MIVIGWSVSAQTQSGVVTDAVTKEKLVGVVVKNSSGTGTATDVEGRFFIKMFSLPDTLTFSYVGYETKLFLLQEITDEILRISLNPLNNELGVVVVSAGRFEQSIGEVTVSMEVVNSKLLQDKNVITADEAMQQTPGVIIVDGEPQIRSGSGYSFGAGSRVQILVDDLPVLSGDAGRVSWGFLPVENVSQIEVIKGASSVLYGSAALSGVMNFRTSYPADTARTIVNVFHGVYSRPRNSESVYWSGNNMRSGVNFLHSQKFGQLDLVVGGSYLGDDGHLGPIKDTADGSFTNGYNPFTADRYYATNRGRMNMNLRYRFKKFTGLSIGLNTNWSSGNSLATLLWENSQSGLYSAFRGSATRTIQLLGTVDPYITYFNNKGGKHSLRTRWQSLDNNNDNDQDNFSDVYYGEYQYQQDWGEGYGLKNLTTTAGVVAIHTNATGQLFSGGNSDGTNTSDNYAAYFQVDKKFFEKLNVSAGVRYEYFRINDDSDGKPVFRAGANYRLGQATFVRGSFGQGYRFPSIAEKFIVTGVGAINIFANPDLVAETSYNAEFGFKQGFKIGGFRGFADVAVFQQEFKNFIEFTFGQWKYVAPLNGLSDIPRFQREITESIGFKSVNTGSARIRGAEFSIMGEGKIADIKWMLLAGYTYTLPVSLTPDLVYGTAPNGGNESLKIPPAYSYTTTSSDVSSDILKYRVQHLVRFDLGGEWRSFHLGASVRYNSHMQNIDRAFEDLETVPLAAFNPGIRSWRESNTSGDYVVDARCGYAFNSKHRLSLVINNLLNREYAIRPLAIEEMRMTMLQYTLQL